MHSPAPWKPHRADRTRALQILDANGRTIAEVDHGLPLAEHLANAAILAAAPDMAMALHNLLLSLEDGEDLSAARIAALREDARAALAKAGPMVPFLRATAPV